MSDLQGDRVLVLLCTFFSGGFAAGVLFLWGLSRLQDRRWLSGVLLALLGCLVGLFGLLSLVFDLLPFANSGTGGK